jgi:sRNA-binding carbon storage regulator CsrA
MQLTFRELEDFFDWCENHVAQGGTVPMPRICLERRAGEAVLVDGPARIVITSAQRSRARLIVEVDQSTRVMRDELVESVAPVEPVRVPAVEEHADAEDVWSVFRDESLGEAG